MYQKNGIDYFQPWLIIMTDGHSTGASNVRKSLLSAQREATKLEKRSQINHFTCLYWKS